MYINTSFNFWHYNPDEKNFMSLPAAIDSVKAVINSLNADSLENMYLATNQGLMLFNTRTRSLIPYNQFNQHQLSSHLVQFIFEDAQGYIWVGTTNNGLNQIDTNQYNIKHFSDQPDDSAGILGKSCNVHLPKPRQCFVYWQNRNKYL